MAVQVNGKTRGTIQVAPDATQEEALAAAMADPAIARFVTSDPARLIFVKGRLLNIVVKA
jgi:leucyl-tRNA synthetase